MYSLSALLRLNTSPSWLLRYTSPAQAWMTLRNSSTSLMFLSFMFIASHAIFYFDFRLQLQYTRWGRKIQGVV